MNLIGKLAAAYLLACVFFGWGVATMYAQVFPYTYLKAVHDEVSAFLRGNIDEDTTIAQRLANDIGLAPERMIREYTPASGNSYREIAVEGLRSRREAPRVAISPAAPDLYRVIVGAYDFEDSFWGALMLGPNGQVLHQWRFSGEIPELSTESDIVKNLYGIGFFDDGSAVYTMQEQTGGLIKRDYCSEISWMKPGIFHHTAEPSEDGSTFWTFGGEMSLMHPILIEADSQTGETLREIDMADVAAANPDTYIFDLMWYIPDNYHPTHANDIDPLPASLADAYPMFEAGDLALSYRTTNQILVIDPDDLRIKWWYIGAGEGQHDPDWHADGTISIFANNYRNERRDLPTYSSIVSIDPVANTHRTVVAGPPYDFYSRINGHHHFTGEGTVIITSSTQGRVFEVDLETGEVVFEFVNAFEWSEGRTLHMSETVVIDAGMAQRWLATDCSQTSNSGSNLSQ